MVYTELTRTAMQFAYKAHDGQFDKSGLPFIHHPLYVADKMEDELSCTVALLHDVLKSGEVPADELAAAGIPNEAIRIIRLLTNRCKDGTTYKKYIDNLKNNPVARKVKLEDIKHNMLRERIVLMPLSEMTAAQARQKRYKEAYDVLVAVPEEMPMMKNRLDI